MAAAGRADEPGTRPDDTAPSPPSSTPSHTPYEYDATVAPSETEPMVELLGSGSIDVLGLMPWSSNGTFLVEVRQGTEHAPAIYKPVSAERPLWDFPGGLWKREVATWELSELLGFGVVPPTVGRTEAPMGPGSLQAFVPARFEEHYFTLRDTDDENLASSLRDLCVLDLVANATDRKGGHCLVDADQRLWAIDNGLTFHVEFKLRTVIWDFAGEVVPRRALEALGSFLEDGVPARLARWLSPEEIDATLARASALLEAGRFPHDLTGNRYPWPLE